MLGVDDVNFASPDDKVCESNFVVDVIVIVPVKNGSYTKATVDETGYYKYSILITEAPELITVSTEE